MAVAALRDLSCSFWEISDACRAPDLADRSENRVSNKLGASWSWAQLYLRKLISDLALCNLSLASLHHKADALLQLPPSLL